MLALTLLAWLPRADAADLHTGDLVFHRSRTRQSALLARVTGSQWTHVGVVFVQDGTTNVLEAGDPVRFVPFADWAARAADGRIGIRRLAAHPDGLPDDVVSKMEALAASWLGRRYDAAFSWTDDRLYCSELAYKLLTEALGAPSASCAGSARSTSPTRWSRPRSPCAGGRRPSTSPSSRRRTCTRTRGGRRCARAPQPPAGNCRTPGFARANANSHHRRACSHDGRAMRPRARGGRSSVGGRIARPPAPLAQLPRATGRGTLLRRE
ncbi:MAG: YiiX/YebB-like N1pC/P60 family cysteine hydrolase [Myxococcota bacterium]